YPRHRAAPVHSRRLIRRTATQNLSSLRRSAAANWVKNPFWECSPGTWYCPPPNVLKARTSFPTRQALACKSESNAKCCGNAVNSGEGIGCSAASIRDSKRMRKRCLSGPSRHPVTRVKWNRKRYRAAVPPTVSLTRVGGRQEGKSRVKIADRTGASAKEARKPAGLLSESRLATNRFSKTTRTHTMCQSAPGLSNGPPCPPEAPSTPCISHTAGVPLSFCHRMSPKLLPLASMACFACHADPGFVSAGPIVITEVPSISHTAGVPLSFCQRMSALLSPLKFPASTARQEGPGLGSAGPIESTFTPSISQTAAAPLSFCHRMSSLPSLLKSAAAFSCQAGPG